MISEEQGKKTSRDASRLRVRWLKLTIFSIFPLAIRPEMQKKWGGGNNRSRGRKMV